MINHRAAPIRAALLGVLVFLAADVLLAQLVKRFWTPWAGPASQRRIRVAAPPYHHDLGRRLDVVTNWGPLRHPLRTNSLGFKDAVPREVPLADPRYRLLLIGDSFTEGVGLPYESTFAGRIAEALAPRGVEVLNAGVVSYSPTIYYRKVKYLLEEVGLAFDHVVVFLDISDIQDEALFYDLDADERVTFDLESAPPWAHDLFRFLDSGSLDHGETAWGRRWKEWLRQNSVTIRLVSHLRENQRRAHPDRDHLLPRTGLERALWTTDEGVFEAYGRRGLRRASERMGRLQELLATHDVALTIVVYPWPDQILRDSPASRQVRFWREWAASRGVAFVDLFEPFFSQASEPESVMSRYYVPADVHFNVRGHELVATSFLERFEVSLEGALRDRALRRRGQRDPQAGRSPAATGSGT